MYAVNNLVDGHDDVGRGKRQEGDKIPPRVEVGVRNNHENERACLQPLGKTPIHDALAASKNQMGEES